MIRSTLSILRKSRLSHILIFLVISLLLQQSNAHEHHEEDIPPGETVSQEPIDTILWIHILLQTFSWGILFPTGMVLGIVKSRWHVPVQVLGTTGAIIGYFLGHAHKGRQFGPTAHGKFAPILHIMLITQVGFGIYLKLHLERGFQGRLRPIFVRVHSILGKVLPVASWVQLLFGGIAAQGFCQGDHIGQCAAHFIMGSAFIAYGIILTILLLVGQAWLKRTGRSQEFFDSAVIAAWGCVNTFTEHRWGTAWVKNDLQHTTMGIIWWCAGLLGIWLSRGREGSPKRTVIPSLVLFMTGWAMSAHPQEMMISAMTHAIFGYTLMTAGVARLIEICFVLKDKPNQSEDGTNPNSFQYIPPFLLCAAGFMFMGATEEQMEMLHNNHVDHVSYVLILYSLAFILYLFTNILIHIYAVGSKPASIKLDPETSVPNGHMNGHMNVHSVRDAEEYELHGLAEDEDEDENEDERLLKQNGSSHS